MPELMFLFGWFITGFVLFAVGSILLLPVFLFIVVVKSLLNLLFD